MLAPAYFSPNYKYFDQLLQLVENKTTVLILVFKEFLQTSIPPLISIRYAKEYYEFPLIFFVSQCRKISWASLQCFGKFGVSKNFMHNRGYHNFPSKIFCLTVPKNFVKEPISISLISGIKKC